MKYTSNNIKKLFFSFRGQLLTISLGPLLLAVVTITLIFVTQSNQKRKEIFLNSIKAKLMEEIDNSIQQIENLSEIHNNMTIFTEISRGDINYSNTSRLEKLFEYEVRFNPYINEIFYADEEGSYVSVRQGGKKRSNIFVAYRNKDTNGKIYTKELDNQQKIVRVPTRQDIPDPRSRPWYKEGKQKMKADWSKAYKFQSHTDNQLEDMYGITFYQPSQNAKTNQFQGILGIDLPFQVIKEYFQKIDITNGKAKFLIFDCHSSADNNSAKSFRAIAQSSIEQNSLETIKKNISRFSDCQLGKDKPTIFTADNYDVYISRLNIKHLNANWLLAIAIPKDYFNQEILKLVFYVLIYSGLLIIFVSPVSLFLAQRISKPITIMIEAADAIESGKIDSFDNDSLEKIGNQNNELGILAKVFLDMANKVYEREQEMHKKLQELEETTNEQQKNSLLMEMTEKQYLLQLIRKSQENRQ